MKHILRAYYDEVNIIDVELEKTHYNGLSKRFSLRTGSEVIPLDHYNEFFLIQRQ